MAKQASKKNGSKIRQLNANAAGIDIGSQKHYVAVPTDRDNESVRSFGCLTLPFGRTSRSAEGDFSRYFNSSITSWG